MPAEIPFGVLGRDRLAVLVERDRDGARQLARPADGRVRRRCRGCRPCTPFPVAPPERPLAVDALGQRVLDRDPTDRVLRERPGGREIVFAPCSTPPSPDATGLNCAAVGGPSARRAAWAARSARGIVARDGEVDLDESPAASRRGRGEHGRPRRRPGWSVRLGASGPARRRGRRRPRRPRRSRAGLADACVERDPEAEVAPLRHRPRRRPRARARRRERLGVDRRQLAERDCEQRRLRGEPVPWPEIRATLANGRRDRADERRGRAAGGAASRVASASSALEDRDPGRLRRPRATARGAAGFGEDARSRADARLRQRRFEIRDEPRAKLGVVPQHGRSDRRARPHACRKLLSRRTHPEGAAAVPPIRRARLSMS